MTKILLYTFFITLILTKADSSNAQELNPEHENSFYSPYSLLTNNLIVVLGSSTAAGACASHPDSAWVIRYRKYMRTLDSTSVVVNLAVGGYTTYDIMPTGFIQPPGRPSPKTTKNITYALTFSPAAIIINLPSNDANMGYSITDQISNFRIIVDKATEQSVPVWITTTQPRNFPEQTKRDNLIEMKDSIISIYGDLAVNVWDDLAQDDGRLLPQYNSGDGIHLNNLGHRIIFQRVVEENIYEYITGIRREIIASDIEFELRQNFPNPFNPSTTIKYALPAQSSVKLIIYNLLGEEITRLVDAVQNAGYYEVNFNASNLSSGIYFYSILANSADGSRDFNITRKMILIK